MTTGEQLLYGDSFQSGFLSFDSFDTSDAAHHSHAALLSFSNDLSYDLETFDVTTSPCTSSESSPSPSSDSAAEDGVWSPPEHPWDGEELSSDDAFDSAEANVSVSTPAITHMKPTALPGVVAAPATSAATLSGKVAAAVVTPERSSRPRRSAAAAAAAAVAESSPPPSARADLKLRVGRVDITEDQLMTLDTEALQRIVGQRLTSADKSAIKQLRRKIKNKRSAATSRLKKREEKEDLEKDLQEMRAINEQLALRNAELTRRNDELQRSNEGLISENSTLRQTAAAAHTNIDFGVLLSPPSSSVSSPLLNPSLAQAHMPPSFGLGRHSTAILFAFLFSFGLFFGSTALLGAAPSEGLSLHTSSFDSLKGDDSVLSGAPVGEMFSRRLMVVDFDKHDDFIVEVPAILFFDPDIEEDNTNDNVTDVDYVRCMSDAVDKTECDQLLL